MAEILNFSLNKKYRNPVETSASESVFCGREQQLAKLRNIIINRPSASVLIGGVRGVGKTSFVRETLRKIGQEELHDNLSVAYISLADINCSDEQELRGKILRSLIRALYFSIKPERGEELESLYDKTYFSSLKDTGLLELASTRDKDKKESERVEQKITFSITEKTTEFIRFAIAGIFGLAGIWSIVSAQSAYWIILLFVSALGAIKLNVVKTKENTKEESFREEITTKTKEQKTAVYDLSADALEIQLEQLLETYSKNNKRKIVFVIDELDKLVDEKKEEPAIYKVVRPLKNLFNLSKSIFIFVGADDFYDFIENERKVKPYSNTYTLFTDQIFLTTLFHDEVNQLVDSYKEKLGKGSELEYKKYKAYVAWRAKNHVFDVHRILDTFTLYDNKNNAHVSVVEEDKDRKGNIPNNWEVASGLQIFITATFDYYRDSGSSRFNEKLFLTLREVAQILHDDWEIEVSGNEYIGVLPEETQNALGIGQGAIAYKERLDLEGAIEDFLKRMLRVEGADFTTFEEREETPAGAKGPVKIERYELSDTTFPDEEIVRKRNKQLSFEVELLETHSALKFLKDNLQKAGLENFKEFEKEFGLHEKVIKRITNEEKNRESKSVISEFNDREKEIIDEVRVNTFEEMVGKLVGEVEMAGSVNSISDKALIERIKSAVPSNFRTFTDFLISDIDNLHFAFIEKNGRRVLLLLNGDDTEQDEYLKIPLKERRVEPFKCVIINMQGEIQTKKKQPKWCEENLKDDFSDLGSLYNRVKRQVYLGLGI